MEVSDIISDTAVKMLRKSAMQSILLKENAAYDFAPRWTAKCDKQGKVERMERTKGVKRG